MRRVTKHRILALSSVAALCLAAFAFSQQQNGAPSDNFMKPGTPVNDFKVPLFNEEGYRIWYLRGEKGVYVSAKQIEIQNMRVSQYTGDDEDRRVAILTSSKAVFHHDSSTAYGPGELKIETNAFEVTGKDWIWLGQDKEITLNQDVKVRLYEGIGDILK